MILYNPLMHQLLEAEGFENRCFGCKTQPKSMVLRHCLKGPLNLLHAPPPLLEHQLTHVRVKKNVRGRQKANEYIKTSTGHGKIDLSENG